MVIVPYYSGSGGFNKSVMSFSALGFYPLIPSPVAVTSIQGGTWINGSAINRIRIFTKQPGGTSTKYGFLSGTKISLYGFI
jgi:hypothetical protein